MSYRRIGVIIISVILGNALLYSITDTIRAGLNGPRLDFWDALYFSIITFSSLGYGEITPHGIGRLFASLEVLTGLVLVAVFVGKLASERQSALLLLIYTSEHQRRIIDFEQNIYNLDVEIDTALEDHDHLELFQKTGEVYDFISSIFNYLKFQSNQGRLASFGNASALRRLYQSFEKLQKTALGAVKTAGTEKKSIARLEQLIEKIAEIGSYMTQFHENEQNIVGVLSEMQIQKENLTKWKGRIRAGVAEYYFRSKPTEPLLEKVRKTMPPPPWEKNIHKKIAQELSIHNSLAQACISVLVERGHWPDIKKDNTNH
jgi:hypothetical protein